MGKETLSKPMLYTIGIIAAMFVICTIIFAMLVIFSGPDFNKIGKKMCDPSKLFMTFKDNEKIFAICKNESNRYYILELHESDTKNLEK